MDLVRVVQHCLFKESELVERQEHLNVRGWTGPAKTSLTSCRATVSAGPLSHEQTTAHQSLTDPAAPHDPPLKNRGQPWSSGPSYGPTFIAPLSRPFTLPLSPPSPHLRPWNTTSGSCRPVWRILCCNTRSPIRLKVSALHNLQPRFSDRSTPQLPAKTRPISLSFHLWSPNSPFDLSPPLCPLLSSQLHSSRGTASPRSRWASTGRGSRCWTWHSNRMQRR